MRKNGRERSVHRAAATSSCSGSTTPTWIGYRSALGVVKDTGTIRFEDHGMEIGKRVLERYSWTADDVESVRGETSWTMTFAR
ncbi:MAG TPA: hypothetical protein VGD71_24200, partial [Kribbella sp.]